MKSIDQQLLEEAYNKINEGIWDRLKARGSQALGSVTGVGQQLKGRAQQIAGSTISKAAQLGGKALGVDPTKGTLAQKGAQLSKSGQRNVGAGTRAGEEAKYASYIQNSAATIANDLTKLGMPVTDQNTLIKDIQAAITKNLTQVTQRGQLRTAAGTIGGKVV